MHAFILRGSARGCGACAQVYKQKVKHLLYEHQHALAVLKADGELAVKQAGDEAAAREAALRRDLHTLHCQLREQVCFCHQAAGAQLACCSKG